MRKVSPTIQPGPSLGPLNTKMDPTHWLLEICDDGKSAGAMDHVCPPKEIATLTVVEHAIQKFCQHARSAATLIRLQRTIEIISVVIASARDRVRNLSIYRSDFSSRPANKRCSCVDRRVRRLPRRKCYRVRIHSQVLNGKRPITDGARGNILIVNLTRIKRRVSRACHGGVISLDNRWSGTFDKPKVKTPPGSCAFAPVTFW